MRGPHNIWRFVRTGATFERTGAMAVILDAIDAPPIIRIPLRSLVWPFRWLGLKGDPALSPVVRALNALGPAYIKFGQMISTRPDIAGADLARELRVLQDKLPPFPTEEAIKSIEAELDRPASELFSEFGDAVAAASIAQVHRARLAENGKEVAVKVLRPNIEKAFRKDIDAFYFAAGLFEFLSPASRRLKPTDVITHFDKGVMGELDLRLECAAASEFAASTAKDPGIQIPDPEWDLSGKRVMVLGWAEGVPIGDNDALDAAGHDRTKIAARVLQLFLSHALRDGYFHADMHQGNMKIAANGDIIAYDFGIMGRIDEYTRRVYAEILYGFIQRDYKRVAAVHFEAGYVPADRDVDEFASAIRAVGEPIFGMDATGISMGRLLHHLFEVTERFGMETRTELILLQRTMVVVEGVARSLDPHINIWNVARPVVEDYIKTNLGPRAFLKDFAQSARVLSRLSPLLPELAEQVLMKQTQPEEKRAKSRGLGSAGMFALGAGVALAGVWAGTLF
ncbi:MULTISPECIES: 2-polyprenylphenol 6-hydroxylase [Halocynthiibacter]|uniref:2-polyprenylphenol 6-hydroxylase n=1 Tax=Halocynthiibacter halioticoli TaxID=2986804 RepID=A0AAE3IW32_9RHOB|nr:MULTISPECIES: 2-polyprenylphenol 6-hydroxylase [Halocynthiibacter]MCV6823059.1 2-polyprenylphenol 6-hydroxylase [Halocynthiibacter halioticoli]MCW4056060.1 2-polyprenylphenol 6-hydroxylase [Halocynthiibacter sp. SDUM655004]